MISPEDHMAILDLYGSYNRAIDAHDGTAWAAHFTEDGLFRHPARDYRGVEELAGFVSERTRRLAVSPNETQRHWNDRIAVEGDGDMARGSCDLLLIATATDGLRKVVAAGRYEDQLVRQRGAWLFAERRLSVS